MVDVERKICACMALLDTVKIFFDTAVKNVSTNYEEDKLDFLKSAKDTAELKFNKLMELDEEITDLLLDNADELQKHSD